MKTLCEEKIAIIIHSTDEQYLEECTNYVDLLEIPEGYSIDMFVVTGNTSMADSYNEAMEASDAKYKLYLSESTFILQKNCIKQCIKLFQENEKLGMLGILGTKGIGKKEDGPWNVGKAICSDSQSTRLLDFQKEKEEYYIADKLDEAMLITQYDIPWKGDVAVQGEAFIENGYFVAAPFQDIAWCQVDRGMLLGSMDETGQLYNYIKFFLRRIQFQFPIERLQAFYEDYDEGYITRQVVDGIVEREILYKKRVEHALDIRGGKLRYCETDGELGKEMNIISSLNRKYVPQVCVMLESLYANNREVPIHVYLMHSELLEEDQSLIREHGKKWGATVDFLKVDGKDFEKLPATELWTKESFFRLQMIELLPDYVDRILYLDVDLAILQPVYDLYFSDFEGMDLIACKDMGSEIPFGDKRDWMFAEAMRRDDFVYCCAGVMLWNIAKLRGKVTLDTYLNKAEELQYNLLAPDQDLINLIHGGQMKLVDEYKYDCFVKGYHWSYDEVKRCVSILHYAGATKPWSGKYPKIEVYKAWWEYAKATPKYVQMLEKVFEESYETDRMLYNSVKQLAEMNKKL